MEPKRFPGEPPGTSFSDFWGQTGSALIKVSAPRGVFAQISGFRRPRARPGPPRGPPRAPFLVILVPPNRF